MVSGCKICSFPFNLSLLSVIDGFPDHTDSSSRKFLTSNTTNLRISSILDIVLLKIQSNLYRIYEFKEDTSIPKTRPSITISMICVKKKCKIENKFWHDLSCYLTRTYMFCNFKKKHEILIHEKYIKCGWLKQIFTKS